MNFYWWWVSSGVLLFIKYLRIYFGLVIELSLRIYMWMRRLNVKIYLICCFLVIRDWGDKLNELVWDINIYWMIVVY